MVDQVDAGRDQGLGGKLVAAQRRRLQQAPHDDRDRRPQAQGLLDHRVEVGLALAGQQFVLQAGQLLGVAQEALEDPGQRARGGAVGEQGEQFVAQLFLAQRGAVLVARLDQDRDGVLAAVLAFGAAALGLGQHLRFDRRHRLAPAGAFFEPLRTELGKLTQTPFVVDRRGQVGEQVPQPIQPSLVVAEDRPHHHLLGQRLHPRPERERLADRPGPHFAPSQLGHHLGVLAHPLAVEARQHQLAASHVLGLLAQHHRVGAEDRPQRQVRHADAEVIGVGREDPFDVLGVGEQDPGAEVAQAQGEGVAVALPALLKEGQRLARPARRLLLSR